MTPFAFIKQLEQISGNIYTQPKEPIYHDPDFTERSDEPEICDLINLGYREERRNLK